MEPVWYLNTFDQFISSFTGHHNSHITEGLQIHLVLVYSVSYILSMLLVFQSFQRPWKMKTQRCKSLLMSSRVAMNLRWSLIIANAMERTDFMEQWIAIIWKVQRVEHIFKEVHSGWVFIKMFIPPSMYVLCNLSLSQLFF